MALLFSVSQERAKSLSSVSQELAKSLSSLQRAWAGLSSLQRAWAGLSSHNQTGTGLSSHNQAGTGFSSLNGPGPVSPLLTGLGRSLLTKVGGRGPYCHMDTQEEWYSREERALRLMVGPPPRHHGRHVRHGSTFSLRTQPWHVQFLASSRKTLASSRWKVRPLPTLQVARSPRT